MRPRSLLFATAGLLCVLALLWLHHTSQPAQLQPTSAGEAESGPVRQPQAASEPQHPESTAPPIKTPVDTATSATAASGSNGPSQELPGFLSLKTPIEFYGKVVDEDEAPILGVRVYFGRVDQSPGNYTQTTTDSDSSGLFSLTGVTGKTIDVRMEKQGYYFSRSQNPSVFEYSNPHDRYYHRPDKGSPVVFHLKKKGQAEPLVTAKCDVALPIDGSPVEVALAKGAKVSAGRGDFLVRYQRGVLGTRYDWDCLIEVPKGGLIEFTNELDFVAPQEGYRPTAEVNMPQSSPSWQSGAERQYFLRLGSGNYARMEFRIRTGTTDSFRIEYLLNPSGSRNLELDPSKATHTSN